MTSIDTDRLRATSFSTTKLWDGYDILQVDAFLRRTADRLDRGERITPQEIDTMTFTTTRFHREGYETGEVDDFLDNLAATLREEDDDDDTVDVEEPAEPEEEPSCVEETGTISTTLRRKPSDLLSHALELTHRAQPLCDERDDAHATALATIANAEATIAIALILDQHI